MRFSSSQEIIFQAYNEYIEASESYPVSASEVLPSWYKELPRYVNNTDKPIKALAMKDVKMCVPFRDSMISGYVITLPADIEVAVSSDGNIDVFWNPDLPFSIVEKRGPLKETNQGFGMPFPVGTSPTMFAWCPFYGIKTKKSHSVLVTHPFNRHDLPFVTTSGIIDSGYFTKAGNYPFFFKEGFSGVIPKGTPIAQVIPFRREKWRHKKIKSNLLDNHLFIALRDTYLEGFYSRFLRQPKSYK